MCHTSAYFVRCSTCKQDIDHKLVVDSKCKNKIHGRINCSIIYPVNMNVEWVDYTHCLPCYAKRDMLDTRMQATIDADAQEAIDNPHKSDSTSTMIGNQLQNDIDSVVEMEKPERIANWLEGHPDLLLEEVYDHDEDLVVEGEIVPIVRGRGRGRGGRGRGRGARGRGRGRN
ncbi:hypothetical protein NXS19_012770 [Fusarium pseudograminearum]|uniref:Uncharacterized protein n=1 Tax=Fusarium pseudograminearum (strain CS3096) TaxID=1028729 RepID=K3VCW2_FUSPC|nr:hypothetical protein FPSE_08035 [Fusarium pseudograminearum CS3096]EKJ71767.1 hypothetical protein FPSE_08035 [Fusarium pseudograminearum CS3096]UZP44958.1 hypothetical protein NXS19_012770 [Fusarium pseudograminearum]